MAPGNREIYVRPFAIAALCLSFAIALVLSIRFGIDESLIPRIVVFLILAFCLVRGSREKSLFNPFNLFAPTPFSLLLYNENVSSFYFMKLDLFTWVVAIAGMIAFLLGLEIFNPKKKLIAKSNLTLDIPTNKLSFFAFAMIGLGLIWAIFKLPLYSTVMLFIFLGLACATSGRNIKVIILCVLMAIVYLAFCPNKSTFLSFGIAGLLFYEVYSHGKNTFRILGMVLLFVVFIVFVAFPLKSYVFGGTGDAFSFFLGDGSLGDSQYSYFAPRVSWEGDSNLFLPYMYLTTPWCNLQYVIQNQGFTAHGLWAIRPLMGYLQFDKLYAGLSLVPYSTFNTFTAFALPYADFGVASVILESFILGIFVKYVYSISWITKAPLAMGAYSLVACAVLEMFFSNHFLGLSYPFTVVILAAIVGFLFKRAYGLKGSRIEIWDKDES